MHRDEVTVDGTLVRRLLAGQFPEWADLPLEPVEPRGTDNWLFRLGEELVVRLPCRERTVATLVRERTWLPRLTGRLPLEIPLPAAAGEPGAGYPWTWSVYRWLDGESAIDAPVADLAQAAVDLAALLEALQRIDPGGGPGPGEENFFRGAPLVTFDPRVRADLARLRDELDVGAATAVWDEALQTPPEGPPVWVHGDLDRRNLLTRQGRLAAVVDFGCLGVGDPACDVAVAWKVLSPEARGIFRSALSVDDATWARARGWVVSQAVGALAYYTAETNPSLVGEGRRWLADAL